MKVILCNIKWTNPKQLLIGALTWSKVCHAALLFDGEEKLYDASESRGNVNWGKTLKEMGKQKITVYDIPEDETVPKKYALSKLGTKYDWRGIMGWAPFLPSNDAQTVYCFELVLQTLLTMTKINSINVRPISGDLRQKLFRKPIDSDDIFVLLERAQLTAVYVGKAEEYMNDKV